MATVAQKTPLPTNKVSAFVIATALMEASRYIVQHIAPSLYDEGLWSALTPVVGFAVAYFVKDAPNV